MPDWETTCTLVLGFVVVLFIGKRILGSRNVYSLPPGPPRIPWVGNVIGIDAGAPWKTYAEWARTYGDIVYAQLFGEHIIIINSEKIAKDLLEKRSSNYSDRPHLFTIEMCGFDFHSVLLPYGDLWRLHRRFFHQTFRLEAAMRFRPLLHRKSCDLLRHLLDTPEQLDDHVFEFAASVILNSTYDYDPPSRKDEFIDTVEKVLRLDIAATRADISIVVGAFPLVLRLPSWFPGMSFKREMEMARSFLKNYVERPFEYSLQRARNGIVGPSMVHDALRLTNEKGISPEEPWIDALKKGTASASIAASETSHSVLMTFFLMMVLNPEAQEKAQAQIDTVVGTGRLPSLDDRPLLPFVEAVIRELLRSNPVVPLSIPHATVDDDAYDGFHIPKGAFVIANLWSMGHDESVYPNSHVFMPERFLNEGGSLKPQTVENITYGFGRRICVGRHFADASIWIVIAKVLAVFKISKSLDENGVEIPVEPKFSSGIIIHPLPFGYRIVPRFPRMDAQRLEQLIAASTA